MRIFVKYFLSKIRFAHLRTMNISNKIEKIKFLFIRLSSMGDILLTSPVIRSIRAKFPNSEIHFLVAKQFKDVLLGNPNIDKLLIYDKSKSMSEILQWKNKLISDFGKYDYVIDLHNNLRSKIFRKNLAAKIYSIPKRRLHKLALVNFKRSPFKAIHVVDNYFKAVQQLEVYPDSGGLDITQSPNFTIFKYFTKSDTKIIAIAPGAAHFTKRLPSQKYIEIINLLNQSGDFSFVLIGGLADKELCNTIQESASGQIINLSGELSISETAKAIGESDLLITNDTGVMHIGAAVQTPLIAVFGSTTPSLGFSPYNCIHQIIEANLPCRPCTHIGLKECPKRHFNCMNLIESQNVVSTAIRILESGDDSYTNIK